MNVHNSDNNETKKKNEIRWIWTGRRIRELYEIDRWEETKDENPLQSQITQLLFPTINPIDIKETKSLAKILNLKQQREVTSLS